MIENTTQKRVAWNKGKKMPPELIEKNRLGHLGKKASNETKIKMSEWHKANPIRPQLGKTGINSLRYGVPVSEESRKKMRIAKLGKKGSEAQKQMMKARRGEKNYRWIKDRSKLVVSEKKHLDGQYRDWMRAVKDRGGWTCRIADINCNGRLEAHHILRWSKFPELRYEVNNGISLCAFHHPRKINDEEKLIPTFMELVSIVK